ncbi:hypothetical protein [Streptomyces sp. NPDC002088]|uniref:hypothetical protein n=1 Tax=Streptomyces sp. NPDC002088 TaxID=3154665 RepID=UPI00331B9EF7
MHRGLHGRGALFDSEPAGLVPRLVGLRPYELRAVDAKDVADAGELPFVVLSGGRGLGKSAVLAELREAYQEETRKDERLRHTPLALIDCESEEFARPRPEQTAETWSPVSQALLVLAEQLGERVKHAGKIAFPRLLAGLVAVHAPDWRDAEADRIRRELRRILLLNDGGPGFGHFAGRMAGRVVARVIAAAAGQGDPFLSATIEATLESISEGFGSRKQQKPSLWYRTYPNAGGNATRGLILLSQHFRADGPSREHAERYLVRALLTDLTEAYAGIGSRLRRLGRPLVLLDNAHAGPGPGLIGPVLRDRAEGFADEVVFVATVRGPDLPAVRGTLRHELAEVARRFDWRADTSPASRALLVSLPPLSPDDTLHIVGAVCEDVEVPPRLPHATHRLTGGNPLGITLLAASAAQHPQEAASLGRLLTAPVTLREDQTDDGRPTRDELLEQLVPSDRLEELTVLAAAHDHESACALADAQLPDDFGSAGVRTLEARLAEEGLPAAPGHFVGDPFVRTLLLLRLHHQHADHGKWRDVHETLIRHYTDEDDDPARARYRLHHELALGDTQGAVAYLRDTFHSLDTRTWLDTLRFLTSAPYFHAHDDAGRDFAGPDDRRAAIALDRSGTRQQPPEGVDPLLHQRVRRLLHAVWQLADPLVLPDARVCDRLQFELLQLSDVPETGGALLWQASQDWPRDALAGRPLRTPDGDESDDRDGET